VTGVRNPGTKKKRTASRVLVQLVSELVGVRSRKQYCHFTVSR